MRNLRIGNVGIMSENKILLELSDGRTLTFSLQKLLTLVPDETITDRDEDTIDPDCAVATGLPGREI